MDRWNLPRESGPDQGECRTPSSNRLPVSLNGRVYEVDALLVGHKVTLRYDPEAPPGRPIDVVHDGKPSGKATPLDAYANTAVRRSRPAREIEADAPPPEPPPSPLRMRNFKRNE